MIAMKTKIIKKYENLNLEMIQELKKKYPNGFRDHLTSFQNHKGEFIAAIPFETEKYLYLIKIQKEFLGIVENGSDDLDDDENVLNINPKDKASDIESQLGFDNQNTCDE